jgi:two-component system sensor histidine kinase KdpD
MSGIKLIAKLYELSGATVYIVITGYASTDSAIEAVKQRSIVAYETKPINMERLLSLIRQVVERKQMEEKVRQLEALRELDQLRRRLLATVSHELRTPLASIKGYTTMLLDYDARLEHDEKREYLESIDKATDRLTELVDNLLDMSRLEAGLLKLEKAPISISKLLRETVTEARVWTPDHGIVLEVAKKLPRLSIDAKRIRQVLDNLIDNASKYSGQGTEILVSTKQVGQELMLSVADQGIGIPAEELPRVFDPMYRISQRLTPEAGGAGLGLTICKGLVEAHGGRIWMESEEGKGSTCFFTLPLDTKEDHHGEEV